MARHARFIVPGHPQHIIQRGNNRDIIFVDKGDDRFYLEKLQSACQTFHCKIHTCVLMTNHVHLLLTPETKEGPEKVMQSVRHSYVQYFNYRYQRTNRGLLLGTDKFRSKVEAISGQRLRNIKPGSNIESLL